MRKLKFAMVFAALFAVVSLFAQPPGGGQGGQGGPNRGEGGQSSEGGERPQRGQMANMTPEQRSMRAVEMLNRIVSLDSVQMDLVYNLNLTMNEPLPSQLSEEEAKEMSRKERKAYDELLKGEREQRDADFQIALYDILTPPQIEAYESYVKEMKERMQNRQQGQGGQGGPGGQGGMGGGQGGGMGGMGGGRM